MAVADESTMRIIGRFQQQNIVNTMHFRTVTQGSGEDDVLDNLINGWLNDHESEWLSLHSTAYELVGIKAFGLTGASRTPSAVSVDAGGTRSGTPMPAFNCRTITLYTADPKHRRRGRLMCSGSITEDFDTDDGSLTSAALTLLATVGANLIQTITFAGDEFVPGIPAAGVDLWQDFTDVKSRETPSVVRSRRIREFFIG